FVDCRCVFVVVVFFFLCLRRPLISTLFPYTTLFRSFLGASAHPQAPRAKTMTNMSDASLLIIIPPYNRNYILALWVLSFRGDHRSEEHTSELQSRENLVCRLLLEKKKKKKKQ